MQSNGTFAPPNSTFATYFAPSPFRYPGGKSWLIPLYIQWVSARGRHPRLFVEPFAGGANVGLYAAENDLCDHVILVEKEPAIAAVWTTILANPARLIQFIESFRPTSKNLYRWLECEPQSRDELAFKTILKNRVSRGGVTAAGAGILNSGERGNGVFSRWYPETLVGRIRRVHRRKGKISFFHGDAFHALEALVKERNSFFFIDPPYSSHLSAPGKRLYLQNSVDHRGLFTLAARMKGDVLLTYNACQSVRLLAMESGFAVTSAKMRTSHHRRKKELLIAKDLRWLM